MTTLLETGKKFVEALSGGRIKDAFAEIDRAVVLKQRLTDEIYGNAAPSGRSRGRPRTAPATGTDRSRRGRKAAGANGRFRRNQLPALLAEKGPMTRAEIGAATGWSPATLNLHLPALVKAGAIAEDGEYYRAWAGAAPPQQKDAAA